MARVPQLPPRLFPARVRSGRAPPPSAATSNLRRWRDIDVAQEIICGSVVDPRRRLGPALVAGNVFVVLAGLLEHTMLPAEMSISGLKASAIVRYTVHARSLLLKAVNKRFASCARSVRGELMYFEDLARPLAARINSFAWSMRSETWESRGVIHFCVISSSEMSDSQLFE